MRRNLILMTFMIVFLSLLSGCNTSSSTKRDITSTTATNNTTSTKTSLDSLTFELSDDGLYYIVSGKEDLEYNSLDIPETYNEKPVEEIKENAFKSNKTIKTVYIPNSITKIGENAFEGCEGIEKIDISSLESWLKIDFTSVTSNPLYYAHNLYINDELITKLEIPSEIGVLKQYAFAGCTSLKEVVIPKTVGFIGKGPFVHCSSLESMTIPFIGHEIYTPKDIYLFSYFFVVNPNKTSSNMGSVPSSLKKVTLLSGPTAIRSNQFSSCSSIESIILPDSIKTIESQAFSSCRSLVSLIIPDNVTSIGQEAFASCLSLVTITLGERVSEIKENAFFNCTKITEIINKSDLTLVEGSYENGGIAYSAKNIITDEADSRIQIVDDSFILYDDNEDITLVEYTGLETEVAIPNNVTIIGNKAFNKFSDSSLETVTIPNGVKKIEDSAFYNCSNLKLVTIPTALKEVESSAFYGCRGIRLNIESIESWCNIDFYSEETNPLYNQGSLYLNDEFLQDIVVPLGTTIIKDYAFSHYQFLKSITIPSSVVSIGRYAFSYCLNLQTVTIEDGLTSIESFAFYMCRKLETINIPSTLTRIKESTFSSCDSLKSIVIPGSVKTIEYYAFNCCFELKSVKIENGVTTIESSAFYRCSKLDQIIIPNTVEEIGMGVFGMCDNLKKIYYYGTETEWESINGNSLLSSQTKYYYKETEPENDGNFWHLADGVITEW